jgi:hypothetical protein
MSDMIVPIVHLNGTGRQDLVDQAITVLEKMRDLESAMLEAGPNARDYYPVPGLYQRALDERNGQLAALRNLVSRWSGLAMSIEIAGKPIDS